MIRGGSVVAGTMLVIGTLYASGATDNPGGRWAVIALIYIFIIGYTTTWAICVRIICSEIQPTRTRAAVSSLGQCANWVLYFIILHKTGAYLNIHPGGELDYRFLDASLPRQVDLRPLLPLWRLLAPDNSRLPRIPTRDTRTFSRGS